ncbi:hypothetical protein DSO57_1034564 [Entomophthora muscae]|uniref:Uncharacterized protein n=1 Tax=Entomophthora muscae TaxID=34485 RepID=A0ACC2REJ6_9FUNG|nr:hypothetical protein DSO57_1034564 [Entomophthora muscae]
MEATPIPSRDGKNSSMIRVTFILKKNPITTEMQRFTPMLMNAPSDIPLKAVILWGIRAALETNTPTELISRSNHPTSCRIMASISSTRSRVDSFSAANPRPRMQHSWEMPARMATPERSA